jgi:predicted TIM-barrel fold metal-dependent hydrolase
MLTPSLPAIKDDEGLLVPAGLPGVIDAHVHVFPRTMFSAVRQWFDENAWPIRYRMPTSGVLDFLLSHGVRHVVALQYAHKPGIAVLLNRYLARKARQYRGRVTGLATLFPGEPGAARILKDAFAEGLQGVKLHAHVQCFDMNSQGMEEIYDLCASENKPIVVHAGREPKSPAYRCDPHRICRADKVERVLKNHPGLRICVPHLGFDELFAYRKLIETYDTLWLDTTMMLADYFPLAEPVDLAGYRLERIMYGSDFPNIPYAWDRELKWLKTSPLGPNGLEQVLCRSASEFFRLDPGFAPQYVA